jgi:hypothetical protein
MESELAGGADNKRKRRKKYDCEEKTMAVFAFNIGYSFVTLFYRPCIYAKWC